MTGTRHPHCPVCEGRGGWRRDGSPTTATGDGITRCLYCKGSGRCPECAAGRDHPTERAL